ncbi:MAG: ribosome-associated translation inhibitor RaiA [Bacteroidetes bacterium]|nr:ribosome-associated translation inhibitor RaiA [Bacteroidota bacterium]
MKVKIQSIHFDADKKLLDFITEKMDKLLHFYDHIIQSEVFLKIDKSDDSSNKIAEIRIHIPGQELFAKKQCKTFEEAVDTAIDALSKQVIKHKEKIKSI